MSVCIIGAGAAGLCSARQAVAHNLRPTVFEQNQTIGGTWVYTDEIGVNEYGLDVHSSMYKGLRTNLPKEIMGYPDFQIGESPDHKSYITSAEICKFLNDYANEFSLRQYIQFNHYVLRVRPLGKQWEVYVIDLGSKREKSLIFDYIMICNGHYHTPYFPLHKGFDIFQGTLLHSHDYRDPKHYKDRLVLVIGSGPSGMDICNEISKYAIKVTLSHRLTEPLQTVFHNEVIIKPDIKHITENGVEFVDNSYECFDTIIYCTGYKYTFPFLSVDCKVFVEDNFVQPLYKHCVNIEYPTMAFIGIPFYVCAFQMMDLQARFVIKEFWQNPQPVSKAQMLKETKEEMESRWSRGFKKRQAHMMGPDQGDYYKSLATCPSIKPIAPVNTYLHNESSQRFMDDLVAFREDIFKIIDDHTFVYIKKG